MKALTAALAFLFFALIAGAALACSCRPFASAAEQGESADVIFRGRVIATARVSEYRQNTTFEVLETLKGDAAPRQIVSHGGAAMAASACGIVYGVGQEALVIAHRNEAAELSTSACSAPRWPIEAYRQALAAP